MRLRLLPVTMFLAALLLTVKLGVLATGVEVAASQAQQDDLPAEPAAAAAAPDEAVAEPPPPPAPELTRAELDVLQKLRARREALDTREAALDMRESVIQAAEHNLESRIADWKRLKAEVEQLLAHYQREQNAELDTLATYYEKMKAKDAARVFDALDLPYLIDIVGRMKEAKVADIIGEMDTLKAKSLTMELARKRGPDLGADAAAVEP